MIVGDLKPLEEIVSSIADFRKVLILGCGSCVSVCLSGGEREARELALELAHIKHYKGDPPYFVVGSILRQCEQDLVTAFQEIPPENLAVGTIYIAAIHREVPLPVSAIQFRQSVPGYLRVHVMHDVQVVVQEQKRQRPAIFDHHRSAPGQDMRLMLQKRPDPQQGQRKVTRQQVSPQRHRRSGYKNQHRHHARHVPDPVTPNACLSTPPPIRP